MTESSSAGNPDGATLPSDHPLGPAAPVPPRGKEAARSSADPVDDDGVTRAPGHPSGGHPDGRPAPDRREEVLEPSPGATGHQAASIREEQGIHEAGAVPAAYDGDDPTGAPEDADRRPRRPEDALTGHDTWDSGAED